MGAIRHIRTNCCKGLTAPGKHYVLRFPNCGFPPFLKMVVSSPKPLFGPRSVVANSPPTHLQTKPFEASRYVGIRVGMGSLFRG